MNALTTYFVSDELWVQEVICFYKTVRCLRMSNLSTAPLEVWLGPQSPNAMSLHSLSLSPPSWITSNTPCRQDLVACLLSVLTPSCLSFFPKWTTAHASFKALLCCHHGCTRALLPMSSFFSFSLDGSGLFRHLLSGNSVWLYELSSETQDPCNKM